MSDKILKKEDKLTYKGGLFKTKRGALVLTESELYFLSKDQRVFTVPITSIISVRSALGVGNGVDHLYVTYTEGSKEKEVKIEYFSFFTGFGMGITSRLRQPYFTAWEQAIERLRV